MSIDSYLGEVRMFPYSFAPRDFAYCDGQLLQINDNQVLFAVIGNMYGGNGFQTFALPDLRGRAPVGQGQGPGLSSYFVSESGGLTAVQIETSQMPRHNHQGTLTNVDLEVVNSRTAATDAAPSNGQIIGDIPGLAPVSKQLIDEANKGTVVPLDNLFVTASGAVGPAGAGEPHENRQPYLAMSWFICIDGIFPSRN